MRIVADIENHVHQWWFKLSAALILAHLVSGCVADRLAQEDAQRQARFNEQLTASTEKFVADLKAQSDAKIADYDRRNKVWLQPAREYIACNKKAARIASTQTGDPL